MDLATWALLTALAASSGATGEAPEAPVEESIGEVHAVFDNLTVVGSAETAGGSAHVIGQAQLEVHNYNDVHRVLRQVPGVNIQEEDGFGLRPNIGIRGTGVERSQKITLMEDGVLIAPAPYAAPAAYYSPTVGRMESLEVRKGTSAVRQGPHTTGGVINYRSTSIPESFSGKAELALGTDGLLRTHAYAGDSNQRLGWLVEGYQLSSDGFKQLDTADSTGFDLTDLVAKFRLSSRSDAKIYQAAELKLGWNQQDGAETYLGLTAEDFERTPYRRYAGSSADRIDTEHNQFQLSYFAQLSPRFDLTAVVYNNEFSRNWHKLQSVNGLGLNAVLNDPQNHSAEISVLRGDLNAVDSLSVRNNRRDYFSRGVSASLGAHVDGRIRHDLEVGVRVHRDEEDRFQEEDLYNMSFGQPLLSSLGAPGSQSNRVASANAIAVFFEDSFSFGKWTVTPGARYEVIDLERQDYGRSDPVRGSEPRSTTNRVRQLVPGVRVQHVVNERNLWFAGLYQGFSPPTPGSNERVEPEESDNIEIGWRYSGRKLAAEVTGFYSNYGNLLGTDTLSSGGDGTGNQFNGGSALVQGLEAAATWELRPSQSAQVPLRLVYTYTDTEFLSSFETNFADWAPQVERGDELPYVPKHQLTLGATWNSPRWSVGIDGNLNGAMRTLAGAGAIPSDSGIPSRWTWDLAIERDLSSYRLFLQVRNLTDNTYLVARRPAGLRPGMPRTVVVGVKVDF